MATKKKRLTQRERAERAAAKKRLQARGVLPPDKPRLNRKKFAQETWAEWTALLAENRLGAAMALCRAVSFTTAPGASGGDAGAGGHPESDEDRGGV